MKSGFLKPTTKGLRGVQDNSTEGMISNPKRYADIGGLTSKGKVPGKNMFHVRKPGQTEHK